MLQTLLIITINLIPVLFWFWWFEGRDPIPEPRALLLRTFAYGAVGYVLATLLELDVLRLLGIPAASVLMVLIIAALEEAIKYLAASTILRHSDFDELIDGLIYATVAALGFAFFENVMYGLKYGLGSTFLLRGALTTLAHVLFAAPWGVAMAVKKFIGGRYLLRSALLLSMVLHGAFNLLLLEQQKNVWYLLPILALFVSMYLLTLSYYRTILKRNRNRIHGVRMLERGKEMGG